MACFQLALLDGLAQARHLAIGAPGEGIAVGEHGKRVVQQSVRHVATEHCEDVLDVHGVPDYGAIGNQNNCADEWQVGSCLKDLVKMLVISA